MNQLLYNLGIRLYSGVIKAATLFVPKARLWVAGRRNWREKYAEGLKGNPSKRLWMHVSSLGEFEQGRPVLEAFRRQFPDAGIILTFFSPSGYEIRKNYPHADFIAYLPADTPKNVRDFLDLVNPDVAIFVKYDFWANYLAGLKKRGTPTLLISGLFRPGQVFFRSQGRFWREVLQCFTEMHVQDQASANLLHSIGIQHPVVAGDTRIDRVLDLAAVVQPNETVEKFRDAFPDRPIIIAGSTWEPDEKLLAEVLGRPEFSHFRLIIAPHDPSAGNVDRICRLFESVVRYSMFSAGANAEQRVLVIDNVGMLNTLYQYGYMAYIGGGFGKGIHNTLEPAAFGLPVVFGPRYRKFEEARQFVERGGAFPLGNANDLAEVLRLLQVQEEREKASQAVLNYLKQNEGASQKAIDWLQRTLKGAS